VSPPAVPREANGCYPRQGLNALRRCDPSSPSSSPRAVKVGCQQPCSANAASAPPATSWPAALLPARGSAGNRISAEQNDHSYYNTCKKRGKHRRDRPASPSGPARERGGGRLPACPAAAEDQPMAAGRLSGISSLVLGSKSWSRRTLLAEVVPQFTVVVADFDEASIRNSNPRTLVLLLGHAKADALLASDALPGPTPAAPAAPGKNLMITGDSVVTHKGRILEKPDSKAQAREFLQSYATGPATTVSSIVVTDLDSGLRWDGVAEAEVHFRPMPGDVIDDLIENGGSMESAGGLRIEHPAVEKYTDYILGEKSAVMGFSTLLAEELLTRALSS
jgi:septum formation protein